MFFAIALDYLPIQASAVPCEHVFSSSGETDTKWHNWIHLLLMEALQMLKFSLKQRWLDFMQGWMTMDYDMQEMVDNQPDLLAALSTGVKGSIDDILATVGGDDEE